MSHPAARTWRSNCTTYVPGSDKCRFLCGDMEGEEPLCYNPLIMDIEEWDRIDRVLEEYANCCKKGNS